MASHTIYLQQKHIQLVNPLLETKISGLVGGTWMIVEENVDDVLIAPRDAQFILLVYGQHLSFPIEVTHSGEIHQHDARIDAKRTVKGMSGEAIVPADAAVLLLRTKGYHLAGVEFAEEFPNMPDRRQEQGIGVHVEHGLNSLEQRLCITIDNLIHL